MRVPIGVPEGRGPRPLGLQRGGLWRRIPWSGPWERGWKVWPQEERGQDCIFHLHHWHWYCRNRDQGVSSIKLCASKSKNTHPLSLRFLLSLLVIFFPPSLLFFSFLCLSFLVNFGLPCSTLLPRESPTSWWGEGVQNLPGLPAVQVQVGSSSKGPHPPQLSSFKCQLTGVRNAGLTLSPLSA